MSIYQMFDLSGQTAIVTGGGGGLGRQIAITLAEAGASVALCSRNVESCEKVKEEVLSIGGDAIVLPLDVKKPESVRELVGNVLNHYGSIEILVNSSGITKHEDATKMELQTWNDVVDTNLTGVFLMCQSVGEHMIGNGYGKIINISSVGGLRGYEPENHNSVAYTSSKGAIHTLTKDLGVKWGRHGVYVNAIAPGIFITNMNKERLNPVKDKVVKDIPLGKIGGSNDLGGTVLYFASSASNHTTAQILAVDGGSSAK